MFTSASTSKSVVEKKASKVKFASCNKPSCHFDHLIDPGVCIMKTLSETKAERIRLQNELETSSKNVPKADVQANIIRSQWKTEKLEDAIEDANLKINSAKSLIRLYLSDPCLGFQMKERFAQILYVLDGKTPDYESQIVDRRPANEVILTKNESFKLSLSDCPTKSSLQSQIKKEDQSKKMPSLVFAKVNGNACNYLYVDNETVVAKDFNQNTSASSSYYCHEAPAKTEPQRICHLDVKANVPQLVHAVRDVPGERYHDFIAPHVWHKIKDVRESELELCKPCGKSTEIGTTVFKCQDCKVTCHSECKEKAELICVIPPHLYL